MPMLNQPVHTRIHAEWRNNNFPTLGQHTGINDMAILQ